MSHLVFSYDKSVLVMLKPEEALLLQHLGRINIFPTLFFEVLGNLKKDSGNADFSAEQVVKALARKLPYVNHHTNVHHTTLIHSELVLGTEIEMIGMPIDSAPTVVSQLSDGRRGVVMSESVEEKALRFWRKGEFNEFDRLLATEWKSGQDGMDLEKLAAIMRSRSKDRTITTLQELKKSSDKILEERSRDNPEIVIRELCSRFLDNYEDQDKALQRYWKLCQEQNVIIPPKIFAPYAYYVYSVELFYILGLQHQLLPSGKDSKSNIDLQYLYYLPFCQSFSSEDKFHRKVVPLFLNPKQSFLGGKELKADLAALSTHLSALPEREQSKEKSMLPITSVPIPALIEALDRSKPNWRKISGDIKDQLTPEQQAKIVQEAERMMGSVLDQSLAPFPPSNPDKSQFIVKTRLLTPEQVKNAYNKDQDDQKN